MKESLNRLLAALCAMLVLIAAYPAAAAPQNLFALMKTTDLSLEPFDAGIFSKRPTMLYLWASGRGLCIDELPALESLSREYAGRLNLVGVLLNAVSASGKAIDNAALASARKSLDYAGVSFPNIIGTPELYEMMNNLGVSAVPTVWLVDTGGTILYQSVGALGAQGYRKVISDILPAHSGLADTDKDTSGQHNLYYDDFEDGSRHWDLDQGWKLSTDGVNHVLQGKEHHWAVLKEGSWTNYALSARFKLTAGTIHFSYRRSEVQGGLKRYFIGVSKGSLYLNKQVENKFTDLAQAELNLGSGWHTIDIRGYGGLLNVRIDGVLRIAHEDRDAITMGGIAFETLDNAQCLVDDVKVIATGQGDVSAASKNELPVDSSKPFAADETHVGDLVLSGTTVRVIENMNYLQQGHVYIKDKAKLIIRNAVFMLGRGREPTIHSYINVDRYAALEIEDSSIIPETPASGMGALVVIRNAGTMTMKNAPTQIHLLETYQNAKLAITDSEMVNPIGGLLQVMGGDTRVVRSTLGALALTLSQKDGACKVSGISSGTYLQRFDVHQLIPKASYDLMLEDTTILKDDIEPGPYERGWLFFAGPGASLDASDCELRKVFIGLKNETAAFDELKIGVPCSLKYKKITLDDIIMRGQWPFEIADSNVTISDSQYLFIQISGKSKLTLTDSHMVEFIPRNFSGTITFDHCRWTNAGEIIGGEAYHSLSNNFTMKGSLSIANELKLHLQWQDARVTRVYDAVVTNAKDLPLSGLTVKINGRIYKTNDQGEVQFSLVHEQDSYKQPRVLEILDGNQLLAGRNIDFFTETPIIIKTK